MQKRHLTSIQVRYKDLDSLGHVNNANHLTYFELARIKFFDDIVNEKIDWEKVGMIVDAYTPSCTSASRNAHAAPRERDQLGAERCELARREPGAERDRR